MIPEYRATARYEGTWWAVAFDNLPPKHGGATQGRSWKEAEKNARECVALLLGVEEHEFNLTLRLADPEEAKMIDDLKQARSDADAANRRAVKALDAAAQRLAAKYRLRDVGAMLGGLSHQYVAKLAPGSKKK